MKKFLLVLSCCLATWCSVLAGPKSSPEISLMQASAPAPTNYPAVINSANYDSSTNQIVVNYTVNTAGDVAFNLQTSNDVIKNLKKMYRPKGTYTIGIDLKSEWSIGAYVSLMISVGGNVCGGTGVPIPRVSVNINDVSYIAKNKTVTVKYSIYDPDSKSGNCYIRVRKNSATGLKIVEEKISSSSTAYEIPSSKFTIGAVYYVEVSCGNVKKSQNYIFDNVRSGYLGKVSVGDYNVTFNYTMKNASDPYIAIKQGSKYGPVVKKIQITNTNGDYKEKSLYYHSVLKEKTTYVAELYDGSEPLRIYSEEFTIPEKEPVIIEPLCFEWHFDEGANQIKVWCTRAPSSSVYIEVYNYNNGVQGSIQGHASGSSKDVHSISIPRATSQGQGYIIYVSSGSEKKSIKVHIANHLNK